MTDQRSAICRSLGTSRLALRIAFLRYGLPLRRRLGVTNIAWSALYALPPETKIFAFRDIEAQRSLRDQLRGTLTKLPTATKICPTTPRFSANFYERMRCETRFP